MVHGGLSVCGQLLVAPFTEADIDFGPRYLKNNGKPIRGELNAKPYGIIRGITVFRIRSAEDRLHDGIPEGFRST